MRAEKQSAWEWFKSHFLPATKHDLREMERRMAKTQQELIDDLKAVAVQQQKTLGEIKGVQEATDALKAKIVDLEAIIAAGSAPSQELIDAVQAVKDQAQIVDDQIPDAPVINEPPTP